MIKLTFRRLSQLLLMLLFMPLSTTVNGQQARLDLTQGMVNATNTFLSSLTAQQRNNGTYDFDDEERFNWHFIPRARNGVPF